MGPDDTEIDEEFRHWFRYHRATAVGVDGVRLAAVTVHGVVEEIFRHDRVLRGGDQPASDIARVDVEDDIAFIPNPFRGPFQRGDIPRPHLTRPTGDQFGSDPSWMGGEAATFADLAGRAGGPVDPGARTPGPAFTNLSG